jgi:hypothetical protein
MGTLGRLIRRRLQLSFSRLPDLVFSAFSQMSESHGNRVTTIGARRISLTLTWLQFNANTYPDFRIFMIAVMAHELGGRGQELGGNAGSVRH